MRISHITYLFTLQRLKGHFFSFFLFIILYAPLHSTTIGVAFLLSAIIYLLTRKYRGKKFRTKDGFLMVSLSWIIASAIGAVPFTISGAIPSYTDAFFETMSGFTTTGASILQDIEAMPKSMLMWRALTHWLGGMGIVVLTIAILPLLGVSGISLMKAEAPGPSVEKISPKIANTAKILWVTYLGLTLLEIIALKIAGMSLFDSVVHTFATVATGGFSSRNDSIAAFDSKAIQAIITIFMVLAGINFAIYFKLLTGRFKDIYRNTEFKYYLLFLVIITILITMNLTKQETYSNIGESLQYSSFQVASIMTTTGFASANYELWPHFSQGLIFLLMFIGGSAGSTGGGIKVVRIITLFKLAVYEMKKIIYPKSVFTIKMNKQPVEAEYLHNVGGFFFLYIICLIVTTMVVAAGGYNITSSFTTALATVGNIGPGFGDVGPVCNYSHFGAPVKWFLSFAMMVGRLEIYTVLVVLLPRFWKR